MEPKTQKHHHHILPVKTAFIVGGTLLILTWFTVWIAGVDLGRFNFLIALAVATIKASLVMLIFMNLLYDRRENAVIFVTSFLFLAIFIAFTVTDLFFRGDVYVKAGANTSTAKSTLKDPWISTPSLVAHGKELFAQNCVTCHGEAGLGNGPASSALNPRPRNFTLADGWKNGRRPSEVFKTLREGLAPSAMASYATLPPDDRWALAHYVLSLGPTPPSVSPADLAKAGISATGAEAVAQAIGIDLAMRRMAEEVPTLKIVQSRSTHPASNQPGARMYQTQCAQCHGDQAQGGVKVRNLGVYPKAFSMSGPLTASAQGMQSQDKFNQIVTHGMPGDLMPGNGQFSQSQLRELYQYTRSLAQ